MVVRCVRADLFRELNNKSTSTLRRFFNANTPSIKLDNFLDDGQTDACAFDRLPRWTAIKHIEYAASVLHLNSRAMVPDIIGHGAVLLFTPDFDTSPVAAGVLDGIGDEILENLGQERLRKLQVRQAVNVDNGFVMNDLRAQFINDLMNNPPDINSSKNQLTMRVRAAWVCESRNDCCRQFQVIICRFSFRIFDLRVLGFSPRRFAAPKGPSIRP